MASPEWAFLQMFHHKYHPICEPTQVATLSPERSAYPSITWFVIIYRGYRHTCVYTVYAPLFHYFHSPASSPRWGQPFLWVTHWLNYVKCYCRKRCRSVAYGKILYSWGSISRARLPCDVPGNRRNGCNLADKILQAFRFYPLVNVYIAMENHHF